MTAMNKMSSIILHHGDCADGLMSAYIARKSLGDVRAIGLEHGILDKSMEEIFAEIGVDLSEINIVYLLDFSLKSVHYEKMLSEYPDLKIIVLDHHKTVEEDLKSFAEKLKESENASRCELHFNMGLSGAGLSYLYFNKREIFDKVIGIDLKNDKIMRQVALSYLPKEVLHIQDRDLWDWQFENSKEYGAFFSNHVKTLCDCEKHIGDFDGLNYEQQVFTGKIMSETYSGLVERVVNSNVHSEIVFEINGQMHKGYIINASNLFSSELCAKLCRLNDEHKFAISWQMSYDKENNPIYKYSIRSTDDYNCSIIAKHFNGGGHPQASGFSMNKLLNVNEIIKIN